MGSNSPSGRISRGMGAPTCRAHRGCSSNDEQHWGKGPSGAPAADRVAAVASPHRSLANPWPLGDSSASLTWEPGGLGTTTAVLLASSTRPSYCPSSTRLTKLPALSGAL